MNERGRDGFEVSPLPLNGDRLEGLDLNEERAKENLGSSLPGTQKPASSPDNASLATDHSLAMPTTFSPGAPDDQSIAATPEADNEKEVPERQWADRLKTVILKTKDDPCQQKKEVSQTKADYMKARFNKVLKVEEAS